MQTMTKKMTASEYEELPSLGLTKWANFFFSYTLQGAIINGDTLGVITAVEDDPSPVLSGFRLYQNYPNPFNAGTQIRFFLPKSDFVSLKIFNAVGEEVATLLSERLDRGDHTYGWDASDMPSGIYYLHLRGRDFRRVTKMVLIG